MTRSYNATAMPMRNNRGFPTVADGSSGRVGVGGARNIKSMRPNSVAIFFMTYFYTAGGGAWPSQQPLDSLLP